MDWRVETVDSLKLTVVVADWTIRSNLRFWASQAWLLPSGVKCTSKGVTNVGSTLADDLTVQMPTHNLPVQSSPFIGRVQELAQIAGRLADAQCRLLTLVGPVGIGKTRLALQAGQGQVEHFSDGVFFVPLSAPGRTTFIASAITDALASGTYIEIEALS
jgi:hypothetical protein